MNSRRIHKKNLIISYKSLPDEVKALFVETYPEGYSQHLKRFVKPNGEPIFVVPIETDDTVYMVKFEVTIDSGLSDDIDKDIFGDDNKEDDNEYAPISETLEKEEGTDRGHAERNVRHGGDFEEMMAANDARKEFEADSMDEGFSDDERDEYAEKEEPEDDSDEDSEEDAVVALKRLYEDHEPTAEELMEVEKSLAGIQEPVEAPKPKRCCRTKKTAEAKPTKTTKTTKAKK